MLHQTWRRKQSNEHAYQDSADWSGHVGVEELMPWPVRRQIRVSNGVGDNDREEESGKHATNGCCRWDQSPPHTLHLVFDGATEANTQPDEHHDHDAEGKKMARIAGVSVDPYREGSR